MAENDNIVEEQDQDEERFNSMLNAAQKQVGAVPGADSSANDSSSTTTGKLSQAQIEAMLALNSETVISEQPDTVKDQNTAETQSSVEESQLNDVPKDEDDVIADKLREGIAAEMQTAETEAAAEQPEDNNKKKKKEKKEKAPKEKKEKKPIDPVTLWRIITVAAAVVAAALGFCICLLMFTKVIKSGNEQFAIRAANAVNSKLEVNSEFYVYKAYVHNGALADECMLYALTSYGGVDKMNIYRVVVEHDTSWLTNLYYTIDENSESYISWKESDDSKKRIEASLRKSQSDEIYRIDKEIQINSPIWEKIDCVVINSNITSEQDASAKAP